ncbi:MULTISPECIES: class I SAM-dependent methyltransferase [unclassified Microcystis]|jgi:SAM-dependent methyltransferase|uniref:class I SAM-dependent methyltransferase n=1 Tax=unclassified Microcystis TaxID=2643300 RepID=UPI002590B18B|nr:MULTISPECIES: class I SAM-dependent methyltransferase [unclassified Microcystis]MCA2762908.1 class I SAM-dependent methyltransferase [Microcystis sp. M151S2]MCA2643275.1 class I SAM-dependent methyltransferase [Microcystis sp. M087S2]MCA2673596.1 class I SAM-dependent methyltransferase [Microcystis sp. M080S2]MCA2689286.1 class I SAM-dependent methyltransferase [Microcystis sp. M037S2]MCA2735429.1 class I SAM-dependent methyltransferase [Microcystis sp. M158S2]
MNRDSSLLSSSSVAEFKRNSFDLESHLQNFLQLDQEILQAKLAIAKDSLAALAHQDFSWTNPDYFYQEKVKENYLFELSAWHLSSQEYIGETLRLIDDHGSGKVLDFGGGIGTHALAAAMNSGVEQVIYCDINPLHHEFVRFRAKQLNLDPNKLSFYTEIPEQLKFDTIICLDVIEHLPSPTVQLKKFYDWLNPGGKLIINWYFFKGFNQEYPFHLDDPKIIESFFQTLQKDFLEIFHPYHITVRCYRKNQSLPQEEQPRG